MLVGIALGNIPHHLPATNSCIDNYRLLYLQRICSEALLEVVIVVRQHYRLGSFFECPPRRPVPAVLAKIHFRNYAGVSPDPLGAQARFAHNEEVLLHGFSGQHLGLAVDQPESAASLPASCSCNESTSTPLSPAIIGARSRAPLGSENTVRLW